MSKWINVYIHRIKRQRKQHRTSEHDSQEREVIEKYSRKYGVLQTDRSSIYLSWVTSIPGITVGFYVFSYQQAYHSFSYLFLLADALGHLLSSFWPVHIITLTYMYCSRYVPPSYKRADPHSYTSTNNVLSPISPHSYTCNEHICSQSLPIHIHIYHSCFMPYTHIYQSCFAPCLAYPYTYTNHVLCFSQPH